MNLRQLRKQDKRAAALLIGAHRFKAEDFADGCEGRWSYWYCGSYDGEWDERPAKAMWGLVRYDEHPNVCAWIGFDNATWEHIPEEKRPRKMRRHEYLSWVCLRAPAGFRRRGRRVVPVDKTGAMVRPWRGYTIKTITHPHFGPRPVQVYAIDVRAP